MNKNRKPKPAKIKGCLALSSELGELILLSSVLRDHGDELEGIARRLKRTSEVLGRLRDNIRRREL